MFCINCGQKLDDGMKFCIYCGTRQEEVGVEVDPIEIEELTTGPVTGPVTGPAAGAIAQPEPSKPRTCLLVLQDTASEDKVYTAEIAGSAVMGREIGCTMLIENDKSVSRRHCEFFLEDGICCVRDLGSFNGTVLNGEKIAKASPLKVGDILKVGKSKLMVAQCDIA